jgi:predicted ATP-dependent serine protease
MYFTDAQIKAINEERLIREFLEIAKSKGAVLFVTEEGDIASPELIEELLDEFEDRKVAGKAKS